MRDDKHLIYLTVTNEDDYAEMFAQRQNTDKKSNVFSG